MSQNRKSWVVLALATISAMVLTLLGGISTSSSAAPGDPIIPLTPSCTVTLVSGDPATAPPAPTCYDPSGSDLDEFLVPYHMTPGGYDIAYVDSNMNPYWYDRPNSTGGASQVTVQSMYYDNAAGGYVNGHAWSLTFNTTVTAVPGPNNYWIKLGECVDGGTPVRKATAFFQNVAGPDGRLVRSVYPSASAMNGGVGVVDTKPVSRLYDGSTVGVPLVTFDTDKPGLNPGMTYTVKFWLADVGSAASSGSNTRWLGATQSVYVPKCGGTTTTPTPPPATVRPKATITRLRCGPARCTVRVVLGSRQATKATRYVVVRDPRRGRTIRRAYVTRHKVIRYYGVRKGTVVKVRFGNKVVRKRI